MFKCCFGEIVDAISFINEYILNVKSIFNIQYSRNFIRIFVLWKNKRYGHYIATGMMRL